MSADWVRVSDAKGSVVVCCFLCRPRGRNRKDDECFAIFHASSTNYAEARRLAIAWHWKHTNSTQHAAALEAFNQPGPIDKLPPSSNDVLVAKVLGGPDPTGETERQARRRLAREAAAQVRRDTPKAGSD